MFRTALAAIRTGLGLLVVVLYTIVMGTIASLIAWRSPQSGMIDAITRSWAKLFLAVAGTRLEIEGYAIDRSRSYVFVSNHLSDIDIPVHFLACAVPIRFLAKKELYRVPMLGFFMRSLGFIRVDRDAGAGSHDSVNVQVAKALELGRSLMIYPEGTRSRDGRLKPFKKGAFRIAVDHGMDVVPMAIAGAREVWPPGSKIIRRGRVRVSIGQPISVEGSGPEAVDHMRHEAEAWIGAAVAGFQS